jgi:triphosphatase
MREIELKFLLDEASAKALKARLRNFGSKTGKPSTHTLRSTYFDTPDHALRMANVALRLRRDGRRWIQTVKVGARLHGGLSQVAEVESPAPGGRLNIETIPHPEVKADVFRLIGEKQLVPVCETAIRRTALRLSAGEGAAELAIDSGEIRAGERSAPLYEAEIELLEGPVGTLFDLARALFPEGGLRFSRLPKSARGYLLAEKGYIEPPLAPREAATVRLEREQTVEEAARDVLRECVDQVAANVVVVRELDDPEGPHQLRIGLRRLRSALSLFDAALGSAGLQAIGAEARWFGQEVGRLRDLDVAVHDLLRPEAAANAGEAGIARLADRLAVAADAERQGLRTVLAGTRVQGLLIDLVRFVETRGWLDAGDMGQTARLAAPVSDFADAALRKRWKKVACEAKQLDTLDVEARHELRKELKKLRYAVEFLSPLYPEKRMRPFLKQLKSLQNVFGEANDAEMLQSLLDDASKDWAGDASAQRAVGWAIGASRARARAVWAGARRAWRDLKDERLFWK